eukprot:g757.t1
MSFSSTMCEKEKKSLIRQIQTIYGDCRAAPIRVKLILTSAKGTMMDNLDRVKHQRWSPQQYEAYAKPLDVSLLKSRPQRWNRIVYLSPNATETLERVSSDTLYVLGGIVDRSRTLNLSRDRAEALGIFCAKLPLEKMGAVQRDRHDCVLNLTTVARVLMLKRDGLRNNAWDTVLSRCLPSRKLRTEAFSQSDLKNWTDNLPSEETVATFSDAQLRRCNFVNRLTARVRKWRYEPKFELTYNRTTNISSRRWTATGYVVPCASDGNKSFPVYSLHASGSGRTKKLAKAMAAFNMLHKDIGIGSME